MLPLPHASAACHALSCLRPHYTGFFALQPTAGTFAGGNELEVAMRAAALMHEETGVNTAISTTGCSRAEALARQVGSLRSLKEAMPHMHESFWSMLVRPSSLLQLGTRRLDRKSALVGCMYWRRHGSVSLCLNNAFCGWPGALNLALRLCRAGGAWQKRKRPAVCCTLCAVQRCRCTTTSMRTQLRHLKPLRRPRTAALWPEVRWRTSCIWRLASWHLWLVCFLRAPREPHISCAEYH